MISVVRPHVCSWRSWEGWGCWPTKICRSFPIRPRHGCGRSHPYKSGQIVPRFHLVKRIMKPNPRACVAFIAGCLISGQNALSVYDNSRKKYLSISGRLQPESVNIYDHDQECHISGNGNSGNFSLYHHGDSHHISLWINGNRFNGYDHGTSSHFSGHVSGPLVKIYDHGEGSYFDYSV